MTLPKASALAGERQDGVPELDTVFRLHYSRVTRLIARITRDPGRSEELAVEVFLKWLDSRPDHDAAGWLTRIAVHLALDELRRQERRGRLARLAAGFRRQPDPEEIYRSQDQRRRVLHVLSRLKPREAEILTLRAQGMSYEELGQTLSIRAPSVGKTVARAQEAFRKEYGKRYGKEN